MGEEDVKPQVKVVVKDYMYDSKADTLEHIKEVNTGLIKFCTELLMRASKHDDSKLQSPEKEVFDRMTPILKTLTYGSDEYKASLKELGVALSHHYEVNSHHPEHYYHGIDGMTLADLVEMYFDWAAAVKRTKEGDFNKSLQINSKRFKMSEQLIGIFKNTADQEFGWKNKV